ncbi:hypothetical protein CI15_07710 [Paraburkholderia monticola]|uniref:Uncharacterized protein n=1 Tax=Paraburkholderia monticola TaxID=1399968 RepID=A0A149PYL1_9BURK|nr:hypothetical protein [Paraburkholderia monticola]KXU90046.1 hypothetical protein CI15_07710 [Paraburkholderia monticola]
MRKHRKLPVLPPDETSGQLRARLRRFALATRDDATRTSRTATIPFPEQVTVLVGPLRRARLPGTEPARAHSSAGEPDRDDEGSQ